MNNTIIHLIGHQGVGKRTIAQAICDETGALLVDNHTIANPIFAAVAIDREAPVPASVKQKVGVIRSTVFAAIIEDASPHLSYVLTDVLLDDLSGSPRYREALELAAARHARYVPVRIRCDDDDEYARRVTNPERARLLKQTNLPIALERRKARPLLPIAHPDLLELDVGLLSAADAACRIVSHARGAAR